MSLDARLESLGERHRALDSMITEEMQRPASDELEIYQMKRRKLAIKDEISALEARRDAD